MIGQYLDGRAKPATQYKNMFGVLMQNVNNVLASLDEVFYISLAKRQKFGPGRAYDIESVCHCVRQIEFAFHGAMGDFGHLFAGLAVFGKLVDALYP